MTDSNSSPSANEQESSAVSEHLKDKKPNAARRVLMAFLSLIALLVLAYWVYQRATHVYTECAYRIAHD